MHLVCPACATVNKVDTTRLGQGPVCGKCRNALLPDRPVELDSSTFGTCIARSGLPVVVDFWADWCGPCKMMAPAFAAAAAHFSGRALLAKVNTESSRDVASIYQIRSIPTIKVFLHGKQMDSLSGALAQNQLIAWIERALAKR